MAVAIVLVVLTIFAHGMMLRNCLPNNHDQDKSVISYMYINPIAQISGYVVNASF
jgi:hypothetical protein